MSNEKLHRHTQRSIQVLKASGYACSPCDLGGFDLVAISSADLVLCKVCEGKPPWAGAIAELQAIPAPSNCRKALHVWKSDDLPDYVEL